MNLGYRHRVLVLAVVSNFSQFGARLALSPLIPYILLEYDLTKSSVGVLLAAMWIVFAFLQYPSGILADRFGERLIILIALAATAGCSLILAVAPNAGVFAAVVVLLGAGAGLYFSVGSSLITRLFDERGTALSIHTTGASIGGIFVPVIVTAIATRFDWQLSFFFTAGIAGVTFILFLVIVRPTTPVSPGLTISDQFQFSRIRRLLDNRVVASTTLLAIVGMYVFQAVSSFLPTFLQEFHNLDAGLASVLFGLVFGLSTVSLPIQGRLSDRISRELVLTAAFLSTAVGFFLLLMTDWVGGLYLGILIVGSGMGWAGVIQSRIMDGFAADERGTGFGLVRTVFILIGSGGSAITGILADMVGWQAAYGVVALLLVVAGIAVFMENRLLGAASLRTDR